MSSPPFKVKAVYEYTSPHEDDLHFPSGQIITVTEEEDDEWYSGEYVDASGVKQEGIFPKNFVEKCEPTAPPRPTRTARPKKEVEPNVDPESPVVHDEPAREPEFHQAPEPVVQEQPPPPPPVATKPEPEPVPEVAAPPPASREIESAPDPAPAPKAIQKPAPPPAPAQTTPSSPPPVSNKPSGNSFRDRIAAFNKPAAPPVAPFKPSGLGAGGSSFIKKPFVAPPPSKDAYVPPPREPVPSKIYRREEDPEIAARESENQEQAGRAGLAPVDDEAEEEQPKPTSLKERIALLQKQQAEQASRHADAAAKKEKPKKPIKKRAESQEPTERRGDEEGAPLEEIKSAETVTRGSIDSSRNGEAHPRSQRRQSLKGPGAQHPAHPRTSIGDGNEADMSGAGETTEEPEDLSAVERDDSDDNQRTHAAAPAVSARAPAAPIQEPDVGEEEGATDESREDAEEEGEEDEEDVDPEVRRKEEIRARMAKMSGGMGMHGMFGPPGGMPMPGIGGPAPPKKKKPSVSSDKQPSGDTEEPAMRAPPVPIMALPGMSQVRSPQEVHRPLEVETDAEVADSPISSSRNPHEVADVEDVKPPLSSHSDRPQTSASSRSVGAPPVPSGRPAPPPVPAESRPLAPPPQMPMSPSAGSESDDELPSVARKLSLQTPGGPAPGQTGRSPPPAVPSRPEGPTSPTSKRMSYTNIDSPRSPTSPATTKRSSMVPPIPGMTPAQNRAPPPPPGAVLSRSSTGDVRPMPEPSHEEPEEEEEEEETEYEGDYDTDIASAVPHKDALSSHARDSSFEDSNSVRSPVTSPSGAPPPLPPIGAPRAVPPPPSRQSVDMPRAVPPPPPSQPPPPSRQSIDMPRAVPPPPPNQPPPPSRQSVDMPRAAPPPPPPVQAPVYNNEEEEEYDPYKYTAPAPVAPPPTSRPPPAAPHRMQPEEDFYSASPVATAGHPPLDRPAPPPPHHDEPFSSPPQPARVPTAGSTGGSSTAPRSRQSIDAQRTLGGGRRSTELSRMTMDTGFMANDVDLAKGSVWWAQPNGLPPAFENRRDILHELDDSNEDGVATKHLYILFQDYSQTIITVQFDAGNPSDSTIEQRHEPPPARLRQDQLEQAHERYGRRIADEVTKKKDIVVAPGTPDALVIELLKPLKDALPPVGGRSYGALIYGNLANASTQQNDEIRPGDIITLRNTKFQGKHGPMHAKYSVEVGKGDGHVGVVAEWDGTKKKVRAWEQGRESKKVKLESFKLDDLRSGEVKIWRVMPRSWVGWEGVN